MTKEERIKCRTELRALCDEVEAIKTADYAPGEDVLANLKDSAEFTGTTKYQVWSVYFGKHIKSILNAIKENPDFPQTKSEPIRGRLVDAMVYLQMLDCLIIEDTTDPGVIRPRLGRPRGSRNKNETVNRPPGVPEPTHALPGLEPEPAPAPAPAPEYAGAEA